MNIKYLDDLIKKYPSLLIDKTLKLSDITSKKGVKLNDYQILKCDEAFPNKFELEVVRFWRKKGLLPFFEEGKHAKISIAQLMWLRFLENLRNLSPTASILENAYEFFLESAYEDNLAFKNLLGLQERLQYELKAEPNDTITKSKLDYVKKILGDQNLLFSIKIDTNYFIMYLMDELVNAPHSKIYFTFSIDTLQTEDGSFIELPKFEIIKNGKVVNKKIEADIFELDLTDQLFNFDETPKAIFSAEYFLKDIFGDCNISENAFNIQILNEKEQRLFDQIRIKNVKEIVINSLKNKDIFNRYKMVNEDGSHNIDSIKNIKYILGTKNYNKVLATLINGTEYTL